MCQLPPVTIGHEVVRPGLGVVTAGAIPSVDVGDEHVGQGVVAVATIGACEGVHDPGFLVIVEVDYLVLGPRSLYAVHRWPALSRANSRCL